MTFASRVLALEAATSICYRRSTRKRNRCRRSYIPDFEWSGIPLDAASRRVSRLEESISVLKRCFAPGPFSYEGNHYRITDFDANPKPVQKPHPPFVIGAGGPRMLALAAREADIIGILPAMLPQGAVFKNDDISGPASAAKIALVRDAAPERFPQ